MEKQHSLLPDHISQSDWNNTPEPIKRLVESLLSCSALSGNETSLIQFLDATPIGIAVHNSNGELVYINQAGQALLGVRSPTNLVTKLLSELFQIYRQGTKMLYPADALPSTRALTGESVWADDLELHRGEQVIPLEVRASPIFDSQGQVRYSIAAFQDISDRRQQELEQQIVKNTLLQSERLYRQVIQAQTDLILRSHPDTRITFANNALCSALGLPLDHVLGLRWSHFVPPEDWAEIHNKIAALTPENPIFENINRDYRANNQIGWTQWINLGIFDDQRQLVEIQSVGRDITALQRQIQREQALNRVFHAIRNSLDLNTIFATATAEAAHLLETVDCYVAQYLQEERIWRCIAGFCHDPNTPSVLGLDIADEGNLFAERLKQFQVVHVEDTTHLDDVVNQEIARRIPGAWLLIPLVVDGDIWGSFFITTTKHPFVWTNDQIALARSVVEQLEIAIQQANLYRQLQIELDERRRIEAALRESEARFQNMSANVPGAIFRYLLRADGTDGVLYMSSGCYRLWEVEAEAVVADATLLWQMVHPEDFSGMQASVMESARTLEPWSWSWRIITPSGREKWLEAAGRPTPQANGDIVWDTLILDVTDRKRAEQRFQLLAANTPGVIYQYVLHPNGSDAMLYVSPACRDLWELDPQVIEQDVGLTWRMVPPEDLPSMRDSVMQSTQTMQSWNYEWRIVTPSGKQKWLQASAKPQRKANGDVVWDGLILDVSDRKRAEEALATSEQRLRTIIEAEPECVKMLAADGTILDMNPAGLAMLEADHSSQIIGQKALSSILPEYRSAFMDLGRRVFQGETGRLEFVIQGLKGTRRWVDTHAVPFRNERGEITSILAITRDVTERKQAEIALAASEQRLSTLISNLPGYVYRVHNNVDYTPEFISQGVEAITGYGPEEYLVDRTISCGQEIHPDDADRVWTTVQTAIAHRQPYECEYRIITKKGEQKWVWERGQGIYEDGTVRWLEGFVTDISDRKRAESALKDSEYRYAQILDSVQDMVFCKAPNSVLVYANKAACDYYGMTLDQLQGITDVAYNAAEYTQQYLRHDHEVFTTGQTVESLEEPNRRADGEVRYFHTIKSPIFDRSGRVVQLVGVARDITDRKDAEAALRESESRYRLLAENMNDLVCLHDLGGRYLYVSPSCESLLGYQYQEMLEQDCYTFIHPEDRDRVRQDTQTLAIATKPEPITYRMRQKSGEYIWFETLVKPIRDPSGRIVQIQTTSRDVTERVQVQTQLKHDAVHDALTKLPNRHLLMERLQLAINRAKRLDDYHFAVLFLDLDRFKVINDSLGHLAGDQLIMAIAQRLEATLRGIDLAARLGGDEFVILLEDIRDIQEVVHATERIFAELRTPFTIEGREVYTTASVGIVLGTREYTEASHLLRDADIAMYRAKGNGKARYEIFDTEMHTQALYRLHLENDLRQAIENHEFVLHYQPIVMLDTGGLIGFEALIRWQHPTEGFKSPGAFIAVAEETGLITAIDLWALQTACCQLASWQANFPALTNIKMSVNLSAQDLRQLGVVEQIDHILHHSGLPPQCLTLEITESMLIENIDSTINLLRQLKERGIQISIDDFGTGYSSLNYLHRLPVDNLKVDRSFINQMCEGERNHQIIKTIVALSDQLELEVIAEGVETHQQMEGLKALGYKFGQGYLFSPPLSSDAIDTLLTNGDL